jgi:hypothetical protein
VSTDPARGREGLFDRDRVGGLGSAGVIDEQDRGVYTHRELAHQPFVGCGAAKDPATAVQVKHNRQKLSCANWFDDADTHFDTVSRSIDPLAIDVRHGDWTRLNILQSVARSACAEFIHQRGLGCGLSEFARSRLENILVHNEVPPAGCWILA